MNAGTLTLSTFDTCHYQIGRLDAPTLKAIGSVQAVIADDKSTVLLRIALTGSRRHQRVMATLCLNPADLDGLIGQLQAIRDIRRSSLGGANGA
ncbi:hypothetical protein [Cupriavidus sp. BIC8F]|uniref:hypothetical protein n=1 Tax=Cupriavidus sp. BIC8F TaxID=3079014 RepID=UPI0029166757|nr:hypothetical protein [Cupriavidus sp. BIC8F]